MTVDRTSGPRACVIGWPVQHSRSPLIHGYWLDSMGLRGSYGRAEVPPDDLAGFVAGFAKDGYAGGNVTLPHKSAAFALCDRSSPTAQRLRAVNTLWMEDGALCGDNTDVAGFLGALDQDAPGWDACERAVVFGAGGAARAVIHALLLRNIKRVTVLNRTVERGVELAARFGEKISVCAWAGRQEALAGCELLVNTTSLGMAGQPPLDIDLSSLSATAVVDDIVYVPLETPLLAAARAQGLRTVGGLAMLLHQAVPGFERWFGERPEVTPALRALVEADIRAAG